MNIQTIMSETLFQRIASYYNSELAKLHNRPGEPVVKIVYIAGKVTGLEYLYVKTKFKRRETQLMKQGYVVINPCDLISPTEDWITAMKICIALLGFADYISLLPDWQDSAGATIEKQLADKLQIPVLDFEGYE